MTKNNLYIPVAFAADDGYAIPTAVAIASMLKNKKKETKYKIYILSPGLSDENFASLKSFERDDCQIEIIFAKDALKDKVATLEKVSSTDYYRLMLDSFIYEDKLIALDGDLLVLDDLSELYNIKLGDDKYLGGCYFRTHDVYNREYVQETLGLDEGKRINIGVMLFNLKKIKEDNLQEKFVQNIGRFRIMSEDIINYVCKDKIQHIPLKFNYTLHFYKYSDVLTSDPVYSMDEYNKAEKNPVIFHYTLAKPWKEDVGHRQKLWYKYLKLTPYKNVKFKLASKNKFWQVEKASENNNFHNIYSIGAIKIKIKSIGV